MFKTAKPALLALPCALILTACGGNESDRSQLIYPALSSTQCEREPAPPPADATDKQIVAYLDARASAGQDCRTKLDIIDAQVRQWPHKSTTQSIKQ